MPKPASSWKLLLLGFLASCASSKDVVVSLTDTLQFSREMDATAFTTRPITPDSSIAAYANQIGLETYIVTQFLHRPWEQRYREWKKGNADSAGFASVLRRYTNETNFTDALPALDNESLFLFGRKSSGEYVLVADENNNNSFQDDKLRYITPAIGKAGSNLSGERARVHVTNIKRYEKEKVLSFSTTFELQPSVASTVSRPANDDFYLNLFSSESFIGRFRYKGIVHKVALRNTSYPVLNDKSAFAKLKFAAGNEDSAFLKRWNARPEYRVGDTIVLGKRVFLIKDASALNASVTLKPLRISPKLVRPKRIDPQLEAMLANADKNWSGELFPSFTVNGSGGLLSNESLKGKVVFVNFWFAACPPCIAEFDALSEMYNRLKDKADFEFISFTFESPEVIAQVREKYQLPFPIYSISRQECERLNRGNGYPTNIVIDKEGVIKYLHAGGENSKAAAKAFIEKEFYSRIVQEL